jgi:hypothetical protein
MSKPKSVWLVSLLCLNFLAGSASMAMDGPPTFDLEGDGKRTAVKFPFPYFQGEQGDQFTITYQGGYTVHNIKNNPNGVVVIGPLRPCIGIAVTDGKTLVTAHKHSSCALDPSVPGSLSDIVKTNLDLSQPENLYARIYTTQDDVAWLQGDRAAMHGGKTHREAVVEIRDCLEHLGIPSANIPYGLQNLRNPKTNELIHPELSLGRYETAELHAAVRLNKLFVEKQRKKQIQFFSIDLYEADVFRYKGTQITQAERAGPFLSQYQELYPGIDFTQRWEPYDDIPTDYFMSTGSKEGYRQQRGIYANRMNKEEEAYYLKFFGKTAEELMACFKSVNECYNSLPFYPIHKD